MKKNNFKKLGSLLLCTAILGGIFAVPHKADASTSQVTYIDFEDGVNPFTAGRESANTKTGNTWANDITVTELSDGGKALHLTATSDTEYSTYLTEGWAEGTRPTRVEYQFKAVNKDGSVTTNSKRPFSFLPIYTSTKVHNSYGYLSNLRFSNVASGLYTKAGMNSVNATVCSLTKASESSSNIVLGTGEATANWYHVVCNYDWTLYDEANSYQYVVSIQVTDSSDNVVYDVKGTHAAGSGATNVMTGMNGKTLSFGFLTGNSNGLEAYIDDIYIWSETYTGASTGATYGPLAQPSSLGATPATSTTDGSVKVKMGFDYSNVTAIAEASGETAIQYGAVLVAGSPTYNALTTNANLLLDDDETNDAAATAAGYKVTRKALEDGATLPKEYYVTVTNSSENIGKRATSIGYVITKTAEGTKNIYYTEKYINHSVMSLLKAAFNVTYLADKTNVVNNAIVNGSALETALNSYNTANSTSETLETIKAAAAGGSTTEAQRNLLKTIHFALHSQYEQ